MAQEEIGQATSNAESSMGGENVSEAIKQDRLAVSREKEIQQRYVRAILKMSPGLGSRAEEIAYDLVQSGLSSSETLALIDAVYAPTVPDGNGQTTRLMHFSEALQKRYGDCHLYNVAQNRKSFKLFLGEIHDAVEMRDTINSDLGGKVSISFDSALMLQEIGVTAESFLGLLRNYAFDAKIDPLSAALGIISAAKRIEKGEIGTLEGILYRNFRGED